MILHLILVAGAYLLGSISTAILVCRVMGLPDPRTQGSGNPGATNVLRIGGKKAAALTLAGDFLKGLIPVLLAQLLGASDTVLALTGLAAVLGHLFPIFFSFQGGKGVATAAGVLLGFAWPVGIAVIATWLVVAKVFKISSAAALTATLLAPIYSWLLKTPMVLSLAILILSILVLWRHRENIQRLMRGTEGNVNRN